MQFSADDVFAEAMKLSPQEREDIAWRLIHSKKKTEESLALDSEWDAEIARRIEEIDSGKVKLIPAEEVFQQMREVREQAGG